MYGAQSDAIHAQASQPQHVLWQAHQPPDRKDADSQSSTHELQSNAACAHQTGRDAGLTMQDECKVFH